jgi:hypothetical protein
MFIRYITSVFVLALVMPQPGLCLGNDAAVPTITVTGENIPSSIHGPWYEDPLRSDDLRKFLMKNMRYIDISAVRFIGTRRGVIAVGDYRRKLSDKQVSQMLGFIDTVVPLKPVTRIEQSDREVSFVYSEDNVRKISVQAQEADFLNTRQSTANKKDQSLVLAAWEEDILVIETNSTSGVSVIEKIGLDKTAEQMTLRIQTIIDTPRLPIALTFNRYYTPYPPLP